MRPAYGSSTRTRAAPIAWSVWPRRQGRPAVSETITPTSPPTASLSPAASRSAEASGSTGSSRIRPDSTLEVSTPAAARVRPAWVRTIRIGPRWATTERVSSVIADSRSAASAYRSSALLMILEVTTTMSPGCSGPWSPSATRRISVTRSVVGVTSPRPPGAKRRTISGGGP